MNTLLSRNIIIFINLTQKKRIQLVENRLVQYMRGNIVKKNNYLLKWNVYIINH